MRVLVCGHPPSADYLFGVLDALYVSQGMTVLIDQYRIADSWHRRVTRIRTDIEGGRPELVVSFGLTDLTIEAREAGVEVYVLAGRSPARSAA